MLELCFFDICIPSSNPSLLCMQIIPGVGIVICLADIIRMGEAQVVPGDGAGHVNGMFPSFLAFGL